MQKQIKKGKLGDITFQYNPSAMSFSGGGVWSTINSAGMQKPITHYNYGKPSTYTFDLWVSKLSFRDVDMNQVISNLEQYRDSKEPVLFVFGSTAVKVVLVEAEIQIRAWNEDLEIMDILVPLTLQVI